MSLEETETAVGAASGLREWDGLPAGLLEREAAELADVLGGPALLHIPGRKGPPVFVSVLLHGNETTGWEAVRTVLRRYADRVLPRAVSLFVGNVAAAREGARYLPGQSDFNRIWGGGEAPEARMAEEVLDRLAEQGVFAGVDIHNNSGRNPHYACVNRLDHRFLHLATLFSRTVVYFRRPETTLSNNLAELCPAVTVECGEPGRPDGVAHAAELLEAVLHLGELPATRLPPQDYDLFHTVARVTLPPGVTADFSRGDLLLRGDLDHLNFVELPPGTGFGQVRAGVERASQVLEARSEDGEEVADRYFWIDGPELRTRQRVMPAMLSRDPVIIRQDCLCYLMERLPPVEG